MELTFRSKDIEVTVREPGDGTTDDLREDCGGYTRLLSRLLRAIEMGRLEYVLAGVVVDVAEDGETGILFEDASDSFVRAAIGLTKQYEILDEANRGDVASIMEHLNGTA